MNSAFDFRKPGPGGYSKSYFVESLYGEKLQHLIREFGKENMFVITSTELFSDANTALRGCFEFLGLDPITVSVEIKANSTANLPGRGGKLISFWARAIRKGVLDFRLLYLAVNNKVGMVTQQDKIWLRNLLDDDIRLLQNYYPDIVTRW